tara:strand:- start:41 stop:478 length:438 start_codon:yes stop_codon:yes gene_type:complete
MGFEAVVGSTIRENVFNTVTTLIDNNKLSGWTVLSSFPEQNPTFPCVIINPAKITQNIMTINKGVAVYRISVEVELFAAANDGKEKIDQGLDNINNTFFSNASTLKTYNLFLDNAIPIEDLGAGNLVFNQNKLNFGVVAVNMKKL